MDGVFHVKIKVGKQIQGVRMKLPIKSKPMHKMNFVLQWKVVYLLELGPACVGY